MSLGVMMALVVLAMPWAMFGLSKELGQTRKENITLSSIFKQNSKINWLSAARFFLFGSRDLWFEVPLPFFLRVRSSRSAFSNCMHWLTSMKQA